MIRKIDITNPINAKEVLNVQIPSYKVEAEIIDYYDIPPLKDSIESLQQCEETFFGFYIQEELCGVISFRMGEDDLDIHRLIVHPDHFRKGIAQLLLNFVENQFKGINSMIVKTGAKNTPAIMFYEKNGFIKTGEMIVNEFLALSSFEKKTS